MTASIKLLSLQLVLPHGKGHIEQVLLLLDVGALLTGRDTGAGVATGVHDVLAVVVLGLVEQGLETRLGEGPRTGVEGLLLGPDDGLGVGVLVEVLAQLLPREGVELLDTGDGDIVDALLGAVLVERGVDLAGTQDDAVDLLGRLDGTLVVGGIRDDPLEVGFAGEVLDVGAGDRVAEQRLREEDDES